ncbi:uncharacterized protein EV420DRAFT_651487 [Desarmillaria tabescens]|uniref:Uncharacterized protein n=1 Tax=Armillaria tabescens TaxID=1929756 RepID=A0AA39U4G8_ARMTA|nr:uncharacterized protein EV420DRAFT_651487 [Desarmillaria tabescens]KAK0466845.1 hypothetical protein EV420DRAFT_651487 [Desarmillaria tabescens]
MSDVFLLLDDSDPLISYDGPWSLEDSDHGDYHCLDGGEDGGSVSVTFNGTSIAFTGNTPDVPDVLQPFRVSIDGETSKEAQYPDWNHYEQWYQSPPLADGPHNISLSGLVKGTTVDYVLVEAGYSTSLANSSLVVDDSSREIRYSAGWEPKNNQSLPGDPADGVSLYSPLGGGTTESLAGDDSFSFEFAGTAVYVYGVREGADAVTCSVDNSPPSFVSLSPPSQDDENIVNVLFFQSHELGPGNHTLMCNVTDDKSFVLDYIVYTPSFDSLSDKPYLFPQPQASVSPPSPSTRGSASSSAVPSGAIAGAVAGAIVLLAVFATLVVIWCRGRKRKVALSRSSSFGDATVASGALSPPESYTEAIEVRTPLVPNRFDPNLFVSNNARSEKYASSSRQLSLSSRFRDFGIGWGYSKRTSRYPEKF